MAILTTEKKVAIADTKPKAIKQTIGEEEIGDQTEIVGIQHAKSQECTWVNSTIRN